MNLTHEGLFFNQLKKRVKTDGSVQIITKYKQIGNNFNDDKPE